MARVRRRLIVTLDGPAGCGKSTAALGLAKALGYLYLDTGAMYRALAWKSLQTRLAPTSARRLGSLARRTRINLRVDPGHAVRLLVDGRDVTTAIRTPGYPMALAGAFAVAGPSHIEPRGQHTRSRRGLGENLDDDVIAVAGERALERSAITLLHDRARRLVRKEIVGRLFRCLSRDVRRREQRRKVVAAVLLKKQFEPVEQHAYAIGRSGRAGGLCRRLCVRRRHAEPQRQRKRESDK